MNNCCDNAYQDGGTINSPQILDPEVIGGVLKGVTLSGGVTLDDTTASQLAERLCPLLDDCILNAVDGATLSKNTLVDAALKGSVSLDGDAIKSVVSSICSSMTQCILDAVQSNTLTGLIVEKLDVTGLGITGSIALDKDAIGSIVEAVQGSTLSGLKVEKLDVSGLGVTGDVSLDKNAASSIAEAIKSYLDQHIIDAVLAGTIDAIKLSNANINGLDLKGKVTLDDTAAASIADGLCEKLGDCIINAVKSTTLSGLKLESPQITGAVTLDKDATDAIGEALAQKVTDVVNEALTSGKLCCLVIDGAEINNSHGTGNTWTDTILNGNTTINGTLTLGPEAIGNLCSSLQSCIDERFKELMNERGRVVTDKDTIIGNGTDDDPLRTNLDTEIDSRLLPAVTTKTELPTTIVGGRDQLLGQPDYYVRIGKHIIPAWKG